VANAFVFMKGYHDMYKLADSDISVVLVIRHEAIPMAVDDELWDRYEFGRDAKVKDPKTKKWTRRNPFWKAAPGDPNGAELTLDALRERGVILIGCGFAASYLASKIAARTKAPMADAMAEVRAHLIPGLELAPSGIFAVTRAQEAGCAYVRSA
jgi:hypothetical protein